MLSPDLSLATLDFYQADQMRMDYSAQMHNFEVNYWTHGQRWSWLAGCRFLKLVESLNIHANDFDTAGSDYRAST